MLAIILTISIYASNNSNNNNNNNNHHHHHQFIELYKENGFENKVIVSGLTARYYDDGTLFHFTNDYALHNLLITKTLT